MEAHPFAFVSTTATDVQEHLEDDAEATVTLPKDMKPEIREAMNEVEKASKQLLRGNHRAAVQLLGDALNRIAESADIHGYATY